MTISTQPVSIRQRLNSPWDSAAPYVGKPVAASLSLFPLYYLFVKKACLQLGQPMPKISFFVGSMRLAEPVSAQMKETFGDSPYNKKWIYLFNGPIWRQILNHPANTALTALQKGIPIKNVFQLTRGVFPRSIAVGLFAVFYTNWNEALIPKQKEK